MNIIRICSFTFCLFASALLSQQTASGQILTFTSTIDGPSASAGAGTGSPALGSATATFDPSTNAFDYSGSFSGLTGTYSAGHFHGPAAPNANAGVELALATTLDPGNMSGSFSGSTTALTPLQVADLSNGLWYINIHSSTFGGGEIRGQVIQAVPEPASATLLGLGFTLVAVRRRRR